MKVGETAMSFCLTDSSVRRHRMIIPNNAAAPEPHNAESKIALSHTNKEHQEICFMLKVNKKLILEQI